VYRNLSSQAFLNPHQILPPKHVRGSGLTFFPEIMRVYEGSRRGQRMCRWIFKASWKGCQVRSAGSRG
jgi:hypothetical protein